MKYVSFAFTTSVLVYIAWAGWTAHSVTREHGIWLSAPTLTAYSWAFIGVLKDYIDRTFYHQAKW